MSFEESLSEQVEALCTVRYPATKAEVVEYYRETYKGRGKSSWKQRLVNDLYTYAYPDLPPDLSPEERKKKLHNLEKRFDSGKKGGKDARINSPELKNAKQYIGLGKTLHPTITPPPNGFKVTFVGEIKISDRCFPKSFTRTITGASAVALANNPDDYMIVFLAYFDDEDIAEGYCGDPSIIVTAA